LKCRTPGSDFKYLFTPVINSSVAFGLAGPENNDV